MNRATRAVLLDTCAVIWLANGDPLAEPAIAAMIRAGTAGGVFVSPISAWEIGLLCKPRVGRRPALRFLPNPKAWFARAITGPGIRAAPFTPEIAIDASLLPGELHGDPGDRLLISTARYLNVPVVTRDRRIIAYARDGHCEAIAC